MSASGGCAGWVLRKASRRFFGGSGGGYGRQWAHSWWWVLGEKGLQAGKPG